MSSGSTDSVRLVALGDGVLPSVWNPRIASALLTCFVGGLSVFIGVPLTAQPTNLATVDRSWVLSANDQRFVLADGAGTIREQPAPGSMTVVRLGAEARATQVEPVPCSVIGPPTSIAVTPDGRLALVTNSMRLDPSDASRQVPDDRVSAVRLTGETPRVEREVVVGRQPSGIEVSRDGRFALVANRADGTVTPIRIDGDRLKAEPAVEVAPAAASVSDVAIAPDGRTALVTLTAQGRVVPLRLDDGRVVEVGDAMEMGGEPYAIAFLPDGRHAVVADVSQRGELVLLEVSGGMAREVDRVYAGIAAEGLAVSPWDGTIAVTCLQNSLHPPDSPTRQEHGKLVVLRAQDGVLTIVDVAAVPRIPQAVTFADNGQKLVVGCNEEQQLAVYELRGGVIHDTGVRVPTAGAPAALHTWSPRDASTP